MQLKAKYGKTHSGHYYAIVYNSNGDVLSAAGDLLSIDETFQYFDKWGVDSKVVTLDENGKQE